MNKGCENLKKGANINNLITFLSKHPAKYDFVDPDLVPAFIKSCPAFEPAVLTACKVCNMPVVSETQRCSDYMHQGTIQKEFLLFRSGWSNEVFNLLAEELEQIGLVPQENGVFSRGNVKGGIVFLRSSVQKRDIINTYNEYILNRGCSVVLMIGKEKEAKALDVENCFPEVFFLPFSAFNTAQRRTEWFDFAIRFGTNISGALAFRGAGGEKVRRVNLQKSETFANLVPQIMAFVQMTTMMGGANPQVLKIFDAIVRKVCKSLFMEYELVLEPETPSGERGIDTAQDNSLSAVPENKKSEESTILFLDPRTGKYMAGYVILGGKEGLDEAEIRKSILEKIRAEVFKDFLCGVLIIFLDHGSPLPSGLEENLRKELKGKMGDNFRVSFLPLTALSQFPYSLEKRDNLKYFVNLFLYDFFTDGINDSRQITEKIAALERAVASIPYKVLVHGAVVENVSLKELLESV